MDPSSQNEPLQFDTNEPLNESALPKSLVCIVCKRSISSAYYALADQVLCAECSSAIKEPPKKNRVLTFAKATIAGTIAGLLGALLWYGIRVALNLEIGLVAILVGYMVGKTIHRVSGRGGIAYQILAVAITYSCISANYIPDIVTSLIQSIEKADQEEIKSAPVLGDQELDKNSESKETVDGQDAAQGSTAQASAVAKDVGGKKEKRSMVGFAIACVVFTIVVFIISLATPIFMGIQSPIGFLIVGFALWEAWKFTAFRPLPITGPYQLEATENRSDGDSNLENGDSNLEIRVQP